jgi:hypothetical protein
MARTRPAYLALTRAKQRVVSSAPWRRSKPVREIDRHRPGRLSPPQIGDLPTNVGRFSVRGDRRTPRSAHQHLPAEILGSELVIGGHELGHSDTPRGLRVG